MDNSKPENKKNNIINTKSELNNKINTSLNNKTETSSDEKEDILINLSKHQNKMNDYSTETNSISFNKREIVLEWCSEILTTVTLTKNEKSSIFHRFCTAYDLINEKLFLIHNSIKNFEELKIFVITIFLLTYKLEGLSIAKISISNLIDAFLSSLKIGKRQLSNKILYYEIKILELMDFNPQIFDDNSISQISYLLYDLFKKKYNIDIKENLEKKIKNSIDYLNDTIEFSDKMLFKLMPIDKGIISFYSAGFYSFYDDPSIFNNLKDYLNYLQDTLKIIKVEVETIEGYAMLYFQQLKENEKKEE